MSRTVAILGASDRPGRYALLALQQLLAQGYRAIPINPRLASVAGVPCLPNLAAVTEPLDTVTVYLRPESWQALLPELVAARPRRVILNPGTEDAAAAATLRAAGIAVQEACTLVLLGTGQF